MNIGVLTSSYPRFRGDWAGGFVAELCEWLTRQGDQVEVLAPTPARSVHPDVPVIALPYAKNPKLFYRAGAPDNLLPQPKHSVSRAIAWRETAAGWTQIPRFATQAAAMMVRRQPSWDAVITHWLVPASLLAAVSTRKIPHIAIAHGSDVHLLRRLPQPLGQGILSLLAQPRTKLVLTSESLRLPLFTLAVGQRAQALVKEATVVPMGFTPPACCQDARLPSKPNAFHLLFIGRLVPVKGVETLLRACHNLPLQLTLIGDGPLRKSLEQLAQQLGVNASFVGTLTREQTWRTLQTATAFVMPSVKLTDGRCDSAPRALLEAMTSGLPVIASRVGGIPELVEHNANGLLVNPADVQELQLAIRKLINDQQLRSRLGRAAIEFSLSRNWNTQGAAIRNQLLGL